MAAVTAPATLDEIRYLNAGAVFPGPLLKDCDTALVMFAAGFYGMQDAYWIADAGLTATCVDADGDKLEAMRRLYPDDWRFVRHDVYTFPDGEPEGSQWDVVSLDPWTNEFSRCAEYVDLWCSLARRFVFLGTGLSTKVEPPVGWRIRDVMKRTDYDGGVFWTVLEPV